MGQIILHRSLRVERNGRGDHQLNIAQTLIDDDDIDLRGACCGEQFDMQNPILPPPIFHQPRPLHAKRGWLLGILHPEHNSIFPVAQHRTRFLVQAVA